MVFKRLLILVSCVFFAACVTRFLWLHQYFPFGGPSAHCERSVYDFGSAKSGESVKCVFRVFNRGSLELDILRVRTDCGCTVAQPSAKAVSPRGHVDIAAELSLAGLEGDVRKRVLVDTNDVRQPLCILVMQGTVVADIRIEPRELVLDLSAGATPSEYAVDVYSKESVAFEVKEAYADLKGLDVWFEPIVSGKRYRVHVRGDAGVLSRSPSKSRIVVRTTHPRESMLFVPVVIRRGSLVTGA